MLYFIFSHYNYSKLVCIPLNGIGFYFGIFTTGICIVVPSFYRIILFYICFLACKIFAYCPSTPIVLLHGINSEKKSMIPLQTNLHRICPNLYVHNAEIGNGFEDSFENLWKQVESFKENIYSDNNLRQGFHIIAHSQGGVVARAFIQLYNDTKHNFRVHKFITLGSPHRGVDGIPCLG